MRHTRDTRRESDTIHLRLRADDLQRLRELRAALIGDFGEPSIPDVLRLALKELHAAKVAKQEPR